jgi:predicted NAD/FAD-binding protein
MKIAIIGSGISGLGAAYLLSPQHDITLYEKNNYTGGHSRTITIPTSSGSIPVDTGFIVFNNWNYPNLLGLFRTLNVPYENSDMSFGVSINNGWLEYSSYGLFDQKINYMRPQYWAMLVDIIRFNKLAPRYIEKDINITLEECLRNLGMGSWFRDYYLLAMGASIWSCPLETILKFPARTFLQFFKNHGLLNIKNRPQWYTVTGGSREYVSRLAHTLKNKIKLEQGVTRVSKQEDGIFVTDKSGQKASYDQVIFACHADEALAIIQNPSDNQQSILGAFQYQKNSIIVHSDKSFMPKNKKCWASWVYLSEERHDTKPAVSLSYWMNNLQNIDSRHPLFVTLNPGRRPNDTMIYDEHSFTHPIFDTAAINAQSNINKIQGINGFWFCGAYQRYGFHEDGLLSAVHVARALGASIPWD